MSLIVGTNSYVARTDADAYLADSLRAGAEWEFLDETTKDRALVTAARLLERQRWTGTKTVSTQAMQWPRTGAVDRDGEPIDDTTVPNAVKEAQMELAYELTADGAQETKSDTGDRTKRLKAGDVEVEYFAEDRATNTRFPTVVTELLIGLLAGSGATVVPYASGTDVEATDIDFGVAY